MTTQDAQIAVLREVLEIVRAVEQEFGPQYGTAARVVAARVQVVMERVLEESAVVAA